MDGCVICMRKYRPVAAGALQFLTPAYFFYKENNIFRFLSMSMCLQDLHRQLTSVQAQVVELQVHRQAWQLYKNVGSVEHQQQIQKLQSNLDSMQKNFQEKSGELYSFIIRFVFL